MYKMNRLRNAKVIAPTRSRVGLSFVLYVFQKDLRFGLGYKIDVHVDGLTYGVLINPFMPNAFSHAYQLD